MLIATKAITGIHSSDYLFAGELGLGGELRPVPGALAMAIHARKLGKKGLILPTENALEAAAIPGIDIIPCNTLKEAAAFLAKPDAAKKLPSSAQNQIFIQSKPSIDFRDVKGQAHVKRALEIAAAGGHNIILTGPPGSGKSMLSKAMVGIMPDLTLEEALEVTKIHSIARFLPPGKGIVTERPFRSPHHTVSYAGLIGGGTTPQPGEVSLAHGGILFLDELPEFSRQALEVLRQPLEDGQVTISRAKGRYTYPSDFICIAAMNPCPCGHRGHPDKVCTCTDLMVQRYTSKISGPLLDRIDMHIEVPALRYGEMQKASSGESSLEVRKRVQQARHLSTIRFSAPRTNSQMTRRELERHSSLDLPCQQLMEKAIDVMGFSARAYDRIVKVARTIADLATCEPIKEDHLMEAIGYRQK